MTRCCEEGRVYEELSVLGRIKKKSARTSRRKVETKNEKKKKGQVEIKADWK